MIKGVTIKKLVRHYDDRGFFAEILRDDDKLLKRLGQASVSKTYPGIIKAFHYHEQQNDLWFFPAGSAQVVLHDLRPDSPTYKETSELLQLKLNIGASDGDSTPSEEKRGTPTYRSGGLKKLAQFQESK